jgi:hypothetical protein
VWSNDGLQAVHKPNWKSWFELNSPFFEILFSLWLDNPRSGGMVMPLSSHNLPYCRALLRLSRPSAIQK